MGKPSAAADDGEHVAFHSARKGPEYMLLMRTSLAALRGHLPPLLELYKQSMQRGNHQVLWLKVVHIPTSQDARGGRPTKLSRRLGRCPAGLGNTLPLKGAGFFPEVPASFRGPGGAI